MTKISPARFEKEIGKIFPAYLHSAKMGDNWYIVALIGDPRNPLDDSLSSIMAKLMPLLTKHHNIMVSCSSITGDQGRPVYVWLAN
jgi:hypothetical protein